MKEDQARMATGYFWSILAMMSAPFVLIGLVGWLIVRQIRKAQRASPQPRQSV